MDDVVTVGAMKNTSVPAAFVTLAEQAVGFEVPAFTVAVPEPRFGAVKRANVLEHAPSNL